MSWPEVADDALCVLGVLGIFGGIALIMWIAGKR